MEELWQDLSKPEEKFESPAWHEDVLKERNAAGQREFPLIAELDFYGNPT